ncbi:helix-turn-helix transcriptional regulator [Phaeocystidibacter marisrubri]|uniref:HTH luxR-type domain-containing protein n=1 Tax=Phaeocystidibacter marisrubri TaxID=1577780 RepID=A0A6L3ZGS2_9FLAO|nr:hypothetical protein [Phaeocystidibacter marisrubri]KAB2816829.1 hypothetical protein F8C82_00070 [Phaeocystidibacter marisrubri]GGH77973.1 hypothetical protein GCM10011318_28550 [Phaeocystidibacter marisrubri]
MMCTTLLGISLLVNALFLIHFKSQKTHSKRIVIIHKEKIISGSFTERLLHNYPELSHREVELALQIHNGLNNAELEDHLCISYSSVVKAKYRLRKKLRIEDQKLDSFLRSL